MSEGADWLDQARRVVAGLGQAVAESWAETEPGPGAEAAGHVPGGDCRWCPVCRLAAVARRPEVTEALADALTTAAAALRTLAEEQPPEPAEPPRAAPEPVPGDADPPAPVQHIEIG
ncbi:hypothetical protein SAMN05660690_3516 [Geodermatophilus telluris]|uniref:Uncharacterized protein n=1 Tax=Geodermatophilus telluris TaxID=1190417 RepID=A0A1G6SA69_9ACTN|nr:hypothetical protein [Geodermatophilus telluris]SDD13739.1 hypothetical protein SAMN05660690_3516 [Geodermatophilus telluris]